MACDRVIPADLAPDRAAALDAVEALGATLLIVGPSGALAAWGDGLTRAAVAALWPFSDAVSVRPWAARAAWRTYGGYAEHGGGLPPRHHPLFQVRARRI